MQVCGAAKRMDISLLLFPTFLSFFCVTEHSFLLSVVGIEKKERRRIRSFFFVMSKKVSFRPSSRAERHG